jgi:hypothetical protein
MEVSNWINLGLFLVTGVVGLLAWYGARSAAREAKSAQDQAVSAAERSALAAEKTTQIQSRFLMIEEERRRQVEVESKRAYLTAEIVEKHTVRFKEPSKDCFLVIKNSGPSTAREIGVLVNGKPLSDYREFLVKLPTDAVIGPSV